MMIAWPSENLGGDGVSSINSSTSATSRCSLSAGYHSDPSVRNDVDVSQWRRRKDYGNGRYKDEEKRRAEGNASPPFVDRLSPTAQTGAAAVTNRVILQ